jgi:hypothetical protein
MTYSNFQTVGLPLTVLDEGVPISTNVGSIDFAGAGVTGSALGADVTETIPGGGSTSLQSETPTGAIDDSNKVFTVTNVPQFIQLNGAIQTEGEDYSYAALTITFINAPTTGSILRSYY